MKTESSTKSSEEETEAEATAAEQAISHLFKGVQFPEPMKTELKAIFLAGVEWQKQQEGANE